MLSLDDAPSERKMWEHSWIKQVWHWLIVNRTLDIRLGLG